MGVHFTYLSSILGELKVNLWDHIGIIELAEPLPVLRNNTTSQPIRRLFLCYPLHLTNSITTTSLLPIPV